MRRLRRGFVPALLIATATLPASFGQTRGAERLAAGFPALRPTASTTTAMPKTDAPLRIRIGPYAGWERCWTLDNGQVEAVVVPQIGRIMQFRFVGKSGPFWEDPALHGKHPDPASAEWGNFGGDKTWPAPQADWERVTSRSWPPPVAFDSMPVEVTVRRDGVVLRSAVDPHYGIRTERVVSLAPDRPTMTVVTSYEKVSGPPVRVGVWIITQLEDPVAAFALLPAKSRFPEGYNRQSGDVLPAGLTVDGRLLSLVRDPERASKIGTDGERLLWVGVDRMLLVESPRIPGAPYPDGESSAEIYTNPNPKTYVELEMLGPLHDMSPGDRISQTNAYTLLPRKLTDPKADAARVLMPASLTPASSQSDSTPRP
ncbi:MAG: hypothetical protein JNL97_10015 [Verrucomicrobiales bacterium]|nr:hypothetical protein [Verrucomicrobiales bacterium]